MIANDKEVSVLHRCRRANIIKDVMSFARLHTHIHTHTHLFIMKRDVLFALDIFTQRIYKLQTFNQNLLYNFVTVRMVSIHSIIIPNVSFSSHLIANLSRKKIGFEVLSFAKLLSDITRREGWNKEDPLNHPWWKKKKIIRRYQIWIDSRNLCA